MKCGTVLWLSQGHDPTEAKLLFGFREQPAQFHLRLMRQLQDFGAAAISEQQQLLVILPTLKTRVRTLAVPSSATLQAAANVLRRTSFTMLSALQ